MGKNINIEIDVPVGLKISTDDFINSVNIKVWSKLAKLSWRPFKEARAFARSLDLKYYEFPGMPLLLQCFYEKKPYA